MMQSTKSEFCKFLGVIIDENLTWKNHTDGISKAIARNVGALNMIKCCIPQTEETSVADMLIIFLIKTPKSCRVKSIDIEIKSRQILLDGL